MKQYNNFFRRVLRTAAPAAAFAVLLAATCGACTTVDDTLGSNLVPENQQMKAGHVKLEFDKLNPRKYVETRLFRTDSVVTSNITYGYLGSQLNDTLGLRTAGFLTQFANYYYKVGEGYFGYRPIFDSAQLSLSFSSYGTDTLTEQTFAVYEIVSNAYLTDKPLGAGKTERDTVFYANFDPLDPNGTHNAADRVYDPAKKLFTFTLGGSHGPSVTSVTLQPTAEGRAFVNRLMLQEGEHKDEYSLYSYDSLEYWVKAFKGLYICPDPDVPVTEYGKGAIYATTLEESGLTIYARNRLESDPTIIKDTVGMTYNFYVEGAEYGSVSVNVLQRDYSRYNPATAGDIHIEPELAAETNDERPETPMIYVEGMAGVVTELTFTQEFFDRLDEQLAAEYAESGKQFETLAFSQVRMRVYFTDSDYDWESIDRGSTADGKPLDVVRLIEEMTAAPSRLGLYTDYKTLAAVSDYNYLYETNYGTELSYGGYINRSQGCYVMDITRYAQELWNSYTEEKKRAAREGRAVDLNNVEHRTIYLGPEAYSLYTPSFGVLQGEAQTEGSSIRNHAPIGFDITYTMIR